MKSKYLLFTLFSTLSFTAQSNIDRTGFNTSFGFGLTSILNYESTSLGNTFQNKGRGLSSQLKIGYGLNSQTLINFDLDFSEINPDNKLLPYNIHNYSLSTSYFIKPSTSSAYVTAGIGMMVIPDNSTFDVGPSRGVSYKFGGGYQFSKHIQLEGFIYIAL